MESNSIQVNPNSLVMTSADEVYWGGTNNRAFTIRFDNEGPFGQRNLSHADAVSRKKPRVKGRFKYTVISADNPSVMLDPDIVVEDPPTGDKP
jgi:hypothetical protein